MILIALWSFFEASFWFIAPDFLIGLFCFLAPKRYKKILLIALVFSILGGLFYYFFNVYNLNILTEILINTPFVSEKNMLFVSNLYLTHGIFATLLQAITLIPFKIWTHFVVLYNLNPAIYLLLVGISRLVRFAIVGFIAIKFRHFLGSKVKRHSIFIIAIYSLIFLLITFLLES
jgi:hypothetical protein